MRQSIDVLLVGLLLIAGSAACLALQTPLPTATSSRPAAAPAAVQPVNAVLGDESFTATYGHAPGAATPEAVRLQTHLAYVEGLLRAEDTAHLSADQRARRMKLLDELRTYWQTGVFPRNTARPGRTPVFIDDDGRLCAVGHLVAQSAGRAAAERINADFQFALIRDITLPLLDEWAEENGFTRHELAMIQPMYPCESENPGDCGLFPGESKKNVSQGLEIASLSFSAAAALANGYLVGTGERSRIVAGAGLVSGGAGLALGLSGRANYETADLLLAGSALALSGWSLLRDGDSGEEGETPDPSVAARSQAGPSVRPAFVTTTEGRQPGMHVSWRF